MTTDSLPIDSLMIDRWTNQWIRQLGFNDEQLAKRNQKVEQFSRFVVDRVKTKKLADITKREQLLLEALREYEHRLSRTGFENDIQDEFEAMKLKQKESFIEKKHQELDLREEKFIKEMDQLTENQRTLCQMLTAGEIDIIPDETLMKRIERLRDYLQTLENLKTERLNNIKSYRTQLTTLCSQLDIKIDSDSKATQLINEHYDSCLTMDALHQIESLLTELVRKSEEQERRINELIGVIEKLYNKLSRDDASPPKRSAAYILRHNTAETVQELEKEIAQLQEKRMATSQTYCECMRKKIDELDELCQIGSSEKNPIDFDQITPDILDEYDREYDRLHEMYRARKPVLEAYDQWKLLNQQHIEFLKKSTSAARFHERGYSAVKEQAERKRFLFSMPKVERTCLTALEQWEKEHPNEQFLINDQLMRQIIEEKHSSTSNTTTVTVSKISKTISTSSLGTSILPQRPLSKNQSRKKSLRQVVKQIAVHLTSKTHHEEADEDTFEFTQLENVKHINGLPRIVTSTPKTGKQNRSHTVVAIGRNKNNDPIQKRRPSKRVIPGRR